MLMGPYIIAYSDICYPLNSSWSFCCVGQLGLISVLDTDFETNDIYPKRACIRDKVCFCMMELNL